MNKPITTLFMNMSLDGKISTGDNDTMDVCLHYPKIKGIAEGYKQYYDLEQQTDLHSLNSAKVLTKSHNGKSINEKQEIQKTIVSFIIIDNKPHLTTQGVQNLIKKSKTLYIITTNKNHPAFGLQEAENLVIIYYPGKIDFGDMFKKFKKEYEIESITVQTGGTLNALFLRKKLIDKISIVVIPALIGGKETSTLVDGESFHSIDEICKIQTLQLRNVKQLDHSFLHLQYDVIHDTEIIN